MRESLRKGSVASLSIALGALALATLPGTATAAESATPAASSSPQAYVAWLEAKSDAGASETAQQFKALSPEKQERFLDLINDPATTKAFTEVLGQKAPAARTELAGGDVVIHAESGTGQSFKAYDTWASYAVNDTVFGVKVTEVKVRTNYRVSGTDTTKVYPGSASHYNYVPAASFSHGVVEEWISAEPADNAQTETTWRAEWTGGLGSWSARERVWGDYRGFVGGYLK